jgi:adenine-specific DNA-methyltransferase
MSQKHDKLIMLLKELFQIDQPDLDFGIYRVLHAKSGEVTQFLDKDLLPQISDAFATYKSSDKAEIEKELAKALDQAKELGVPDPEGMPKVIELRSRLTTESVDISKLESEVYDHLFGFFRRYYAEGDFLSKRVYKAGVYAIPYEGEEVKLHWANADQYYIKTSEYLRDFAFRLNPFVDEEKGEDPMRVHYRLADAAEGEHGNVKESEATKRVFLLAFGDEGDWIFAENGELVIRFEYRPATLTDWPEDVRDGKTKPPAQKDLTEIAVKRILAVENAEMIIWIRELQKSHLRADGTQSDNSRLRVNLNRYTARNTFDYFIHKDLGTFLRRELDFYVKNEVMHLDDIESDTVPGVEQYLSKIKVIRSIAHKIIDFLAQLEDFQKRLWLKKKFVVETTFCVTLDRVPPSFFPEIAENMAQIRDWESVFHISDFHGYAGSVTAEFLAQYPGLPVNTGHFTDDFRDRLLEAVLTGNSEVSGVLVNSDNFHALRLAQTSYQGRVAGIYIDPPYNTDVSSIPYKNDYKHSSFASLISDRSKQFWPLLSANGVLYVSIDKHERTTVEFALNDTFGSENKVEELIWVQNTNDGRSPTFSVNHEYVEVYARNFAAVEGDARIFRVPKPGYSEVTDLIQTFAGKYPPLADVEGQLATLYREHRAVFRRAVLEQGLDWELEKRNDPWNGIYLYKHVEYRDAKGNLIPEQVAASVGAELWVYRESDWTIMSSDEKQSSTIKDPNHPNYRFYQPIHPVTGNPCAMPSRGWKGTKLVDPAHPNRNSWDSLVANDLIAFGADESKVPQHKRMLRNVETNVAKSVFADYSDGEKETTALFGRTGVFLAPKHTNFVRRLLSQFVRPGSIVLDCFGGSGSTAHAAIRMNREEHLNLKYLLVEANTYFDRILVPRVLKGAFSSMWDN